jgi:hypothetical protein
LGHCERASERKGRREKNAWRRRWIFTRRFFNHLFDSELGLCVHRQAGDLIRSRAIIYVRVKLVTPVVQHIVRLFVKNCGCFHSS